MSGCSIELLGTIIGFMENNLELKPRKISAWLLGSSILSLTVFKMTLFWRRQWGQIWGMRLRCLLLFTILVPDSEKTLSRFRSRLTIIKWKFSAQKPSSFTTLPRNQAILDNITGSTMEQILLTIYYMFLSNFCQMRSATLCSKKQMRLSKNHQLNLPIQTTLQFQTHLSTSSAPETHHSDSTSPSHPHQMLLNSPQIRMTRNQEEQGLVK